MGRRVSFYYVKNGHSLEDTFINNYLNFRKWTLNQNKDSLEKYNEQIISDHILNFLETNSKLDLHEPNQELLDELLAEFLLVYCDYGKGYDLVDIIGPLFKTYKYQNSFKIIAKQKNEDLSRLWDILKLGRSLRNDYEFTPVDGDVIGFWKKDEVQFIRNELKKFDHQNDLGIECVIQAIKKLKENANELIIVTEI